MAKQSSKCPNCGATLKNNNDCLTCQYCGYKKELEITNNDQDQNRDIDNIILNQNKNQNFQKYDVLNEEKKSKWVIVLVAIVSVIIVFAAIAGIIISIIKGTGNWSIDF